MSYLIQILGGLKLTLLIFAVTLVVSFPLGVLVAKCRLSKNKLVSRIAELYIWVLRGTPLLLQLVFVFFGLPYLGVTLDRLPAAFLAFILNYSAYFGEIFRSGIQSIERGQTEAASILGFNSRQISLKIILPQVIKRTLPAIGNEVITLVKDSSLVYVLGLSEILKVAKGISNRDATIMPFVTAAIIYLVLTYVITLIFRRIEKKVFYEE